MATLLRHDIATKFIAFNVPRADTALNHRFASASRRIATVSVRTKPSPFYSAAVYSDSRRRFSSASSSTLSVVETEDSFDLSTEISPDNRIPVTIITGFLGSGKVRLLV